MTPVHTARIYGPYLRVVRTGHPYIRPVQNSNSFQLYIPSIRVVCTEHPYIRAVFTAIIYGCIFDTRTYGPDIRAVCTGSAYRPLYAVARSLSDDNAIRYVLPVLWMTSRVNMQAYVLYGEAYGRGMSVSGRQLKDGRSYSALAPLLSAVPSDGCHPSAVSLAVHKGVIWL